MDKVKEMLDNNIALRTGDWNLEEVAKINELIPDCITLKPIVYLPNIDAKSFRRKGTLICLTIIYTEMRVNTLTL